MFAESLLSVPISDEPEAEPSSSYAPALVASAFAWAIALLRGILAVFRQEALSVDIVLTAVVLVAIPLAIVRIILARSLRDRRDSAKGEGTPVVRRRPHLVLITNH